jgi:hypothetical protein
LIVNVNPVNKTVDWAAQYTGRLVPGIQVSSPYLHYNNGEGFTVIPDLGAICAVCWPADGEAPFVMGFLEPPEPAMTVASGSPQSADQPSMGGYNAGRPLLNPGDLYIQGRDDNFLVLRRGGVLQIGASDICQRLFIPLNNLIRDVCENWELDTVGGSMTWRAAVADTGPDNQHQAVQFDLIAREAAQDEKASVRISVGTVAKSGADYEVVVAAGGINPTTGETISAKPAYVMRVFNTGVGYTKYSSDLTVEVGGDQTNTISGNCSLSVGKDHTTTVKGSQSTDISGEHKISGGGGSTESWTGVKTIGASALFLGGPNASHPALHGDIVVPWLLNLVTTLATVGIKVDPPTPAMLSRKVLISD